MELREYIRIAIRSWWIIIPLTLIGFTGSLLLSFTQTPMYYSYSTYVAKLASSVSTFDATIYGLDTLTGRERIIITYCEVIKSSTVRNQAFELIGVNPATPGMELYTVSCSNLPETNVVMISVDGPAPALVGRLNEAIGLVGVDISNALYRYFPLEPLDPVYVEPEPYSPNYQQNAIFGGILGLAVGITIAFLFYYLRSPAARLETLSIRNPKLGVYNERYFRTRLDEETNRARARHRPTSLAILRLVPDEDFALFEEADRDILLRKVAMRIEESLREGDLVAYLGRYQFGLLLAETPGDEAKAILLELHRMIRTETFQTEEYVANFVAKSGLVESSGGVLGAEAMFSRAVDALRDSEVSGEENVHLVRTSPQPFFDDNQSAPSPKWEAELPFSAAQEENGGDGGGGVFTAAEEAFTEEQKGDA